MGFISMIVIGFIAGMVARALHPGQDNLGCVMTTALGIVGSIVAGYLGVMIGWYDEGEPAGFVMSILGAILVLMFLRRMGRSRK
ncbi:MAG: GlsB/YeaQ/YmgE family stress response membrane protein [Cardiobacteriaceae bacterium]|nr:GlsB/YeaQ/YmgE family stress response membrane protein [Cardiobacteriaceae bacterium]